MKDITHILRNVGFAKNEARVYCALLSIPDVPARDIARVSDMKRTAIYPILESLIQKGYVIESSKGTVRLFRAQHPRRIAGYLEHKLESFQELIPRLTALEKYTLSLPGIRFIQTIEGLEHFYTDVLDEYKGKAYCIIGSSGSWQDLDESFFIAFRKRRAKQKIKTRLLLDIDSKNHNPADQRLLRTFKYLPKGYRVQSSIDIFKNKILIVGTDPRAVGVVIEIPAMVNIFQSLFDLLWDMIPASSI